MKKQWLAFAATMVLGTTLVGCGSSAGNTTNSTNTGGQTADNQDVHIQFYHAMSAKLGDELKKLTDQFQAQNPNIHVDLVFNADYATQQQKLTAAIASNTMPTIAQVQNAWEVQYYTDGVILPLDNLISKSTVNDLVPIFKDESTYGGKLMSVPFNKSGYLLYYNTDDFAKAGITNPPTTWDELAQDAQKLTTGDVKGLGIQGTYYQFEMFLNQAGGSAVTPDAKQAALGSDAGKKALNFMHRLVLDDKSAFNLTTGYLSDGFNANQFAMDLDTVASTSYYKKGLHWAAAPLPGDAKKAMPIAGTNIVLFKSATPAQQKAAAKYMEFLISKDSTIDWAENTAYMPVRQSALSDPAWKTFTDSHPAYGLAPAQLKDAYYSPRITALDTAQKNITPIIGNFLQGKGTVDDTLSQNVKAMNDAIAGK